MFHVPEGTLQVKVNKQGVRDLNTKTGIYIEPASTITHYQHPWFGWITLCSLVIKKNYMYEAIDQQPITCLECLSCGDL